MRRGLSIVILVLAASAAGGCADLRLGPIRDHRVDPGEVRGAQVLSPRTGRA